MPDARYDPLDALRLPVTAVAPDPGFAAALRGRLADALLAPLHHVTEETRMTAPTDTPTAPPRNGWKHGDLSYLTFLVTDASRARAFYGGLLGWTFTPGDPEPRSSVAGVRPEMGLSASDGEPQVVLAYRVADIAAAVEAIRAAGGTSSNPVQRPYALEADCADPQGVPFYLHEFADGPTQAGEGPHEGDVAYVVLGVPDLAAGREFYGAVLGWRFAPGDSAQGLQVRDVAPMTGLRGGEWAGARLVYRVDDVRAAATRVAELGGAAGPVAERPYGLACEDCVDDQGTHFLLVQPAR